MDGRTEYEQERLTSEVCREYLKQVIDPEIYQNIVDLGLVYGIAVDDDNGVDVTMTLTTPHCPMGPQIIENVEQTLLRQGATRADVEIVWEPMWTPAAMTDELKRELGILEEEPLEKERSEVQQRVGGADSGIDVDPPPLPKKKGLLSRLFGF